MVKPEYVNTMTGEPVPDHDPTVILGSGVFGHSLVAMRETPDRTTFMALAHVLLAMICGSVGAKFAVWIDPKQSQVPHAENNNTMHANPPKSCVLKF